ncbi:MAG: flavodoxin family protein [Gammaproteobacteria bacterium]
MKPIRILAIIGSPRNEESWTYKNIRLIETKMNAIRPTEVEYVFVEKLRVPFCDGCLSCVRVGEESCPEFESIGPVAAKMDAADGIILGAPVHTFNVTGLMKNFVEYFMYKRNRPSFFGKKAVVTTTASGGGHQVVLDFLENTATAWGCDIVTRMGISSAQMKKQPYRLKVDAVAEEVARSFVDAIDTGELGSPKFRHLMNFVAMQNMTRNQKGTKNYAYWEEHDWLDARFYTDVPINPFARLLAGYISRKMRRAMRKGNVEPHR